MVQATTPGTSSASRNAASLASHVPPSATAQAKKQGAGSSESDNCPKLSPKAPVSTTAQPETGADGLLNATLLVDSSYETATRALAEAQRVISSARSAALTSMASASAATKRSSALEAQIRKLKASLANARARAAAAESSSAAVPSMLRVAQEVHDAEVQELRKTHEAELQRRQTAHENDCAWLRARVKMLKAENKTQQKSLHVMQASVAAMRKNVFIESDRARSAILDQRKKLVKDLDDIMKLGPGGASHCPSTSTRSICLNVEHFPPIQKSSEPAPRTTSMMVL
ncbi:hypothetical protein R3P38DRAFT_276656 [Favolaschia claudopus]|uniref:Uncharacterized protein n=1 Tax=Favolaschia claudopus TaxID=2862362 RepID=A0AAV9ZQT3_9AGAR